MNSESTAKAWRLSARHLAFIFLILSFTLLLSASVIARNKHTTSLAVAVPDGGYSSALAAANRFLQAWQNQDHETGLLMLTDTAKQGCSEDRLEIFFSSGSDAAYEIARGKKMRVGRYSFPVTLFTSNSGTTSAGHPQKTEIVVVRAGKDEWAIDKLP